MDYLSSLGCCCSIYHFDLHYGQALSTHKDVGGEGLLEPCQVHRAKICKPHGHGAGEQPLAMMLPNLTRV